MEGLNASTGLLMRKPRLCVNKLVFQTAGGNSACYMQTTFTTALLYAALNGKLLMN